MNRRLLFLIAAIIWLFLIPFNTHATGPFYEGKTIRVLVGFAAGGGFDLYARALARHMGKYIWGNPIIIVENMTGAGSLISANYLYKIAKPDGLTLGHFSGGLFLSQLLEQPGIEFDSKKFEFIAAANKEDNVCVLNKASGITSIDKWMASKRSVKLGGLGPGSTFDNTIRILKTGVGLPIQLISGYRGASDIRLAVESGE
jgi:tripartite-type tricarboxylate transporter receptor subunit TctC